MHTIIIQQGRRKSSLYTYFFFKKWRIILSTVLIFFVLESRAQKPSISMLQDQVEATISKARLASVFITNYDPQGKLPFGARFSGVVVGEDGIILTVAHAASPHQMYQVTFPDGKIYTATGLGKAASLGTAMLKINEEGKWPIAEMGSSSAIKENEPCISIAYPASFDNKIAVVRFGYVAEVSTATQENRFRTTCLMEPGDSGGPVFDLSGKVIGMNNNIDKGLDANFEVPIDLYKKYWNALLEPEEYERTPIGESFEPDTSRVVPPIYSDITLFGESMAAKEKQMAPSVIRIESNINGEKVHSLGTVISFGGSSYAVAKSSIVGIKAFASASKDNALDLSEVYRDEQRDLVLLKLGEQVERGLVLNAIEKQKYQNQPLGKFLCSPMANGEASWSIIGSVKFSLEPKFRGGYSGAGSVIKDGKLVLDMVVAGSGASEAKLQIGDEIVAIDGSRVKDPERYISQIRKKKPGQFSTFTRMNNGKREDIMVKLAKYPVITPNHPASYFEGGRSNIRDGFSNLYVHDGRLTPSECGGPVFGLDGRLVGINVARYSRTSNLLLSASEVVDFIKDAISKNKLQS